MPLYDYLCKVCGTMTAVIRSADDYRVPPDAEESAAVKVEKEGNPCTHDWERHISGGNFQLAGRGWARDGYR
jgi:predicted nucleic acid-binding Zn ribbon protein